MKVLIGDHALQRAKERVTNTAEIEEVLRSGSYIDAKYGRMGKAKVFDFRSMRNGAYYNQKRVEVYCIVKHDATTVITAYVFYGTWEVQNDD